MLLAPCAPLTWGTSGLFGVAVVVAALVLRMRGFLWRRTLVVGVVALALAAASWAAWARFIVGTAEVEGREERRHERTEASFDDAFGRAAAPPPARTPKGGDGGPHIGDDAGTGAATTAGPDGRSE